MSSRLPAARSCARAAPTSCWGRRFSAASTSPHDGRSARAGLVVAPVWFGANYTYNLSMSLTSITSATVISSSSAAFTLLLSAAWLRERVTPLKVLGVLLYRAKQVTKEQLQESLQLMEQSGQRRAPRFGRD